MNYKDYVLKVASKNDIDDIMRFIKQEWNANHILALNKSFFEYEYLNEDGTVNFVIAVHKETKEIDAIHAFYKLNEENNDFFGGLWKSKTGKVPMLGIVLKNFLYNLYEFRSFSAVGSNPKTTIPIQQYFKFKTGKLNHYYLLNDKKDFKIAIIKQPQMNKKALFNGYHLTLVNSFEELLGLVDFVKNQTIIPYKSPKYINNRYFKHPIYQYDVYLIKHDSIQTNAYLIIREVEANGSKIGRIVDYIGHQKYIKFIGNSLRLLLDEKDYEYIDFYNLGIDKELLFEAGFSLRTSEDGNIIPNYFEPLVQQNVEIYYHVATEGCRICKADSDQDRPNRIGG